MEVRELLAAQEFRRDSGCAGPLSALKVPEGDAKWVASVVRTDERGRRVDPDPVRETDKPFLMPVEDVFTLPAAEPH